MPPLLICFITVLAMMMSTPSALGEDGSGLWLRYRSSSPVTQIRLARPSPTMSVIGQELERGLRKQTVAAVTEDDALVVSDGMELGWSDELEAVGDEGFILRRAQIGGKNAFVIAARGDLGALYGALHFLRLVHTGADLSALDVHQRPAYKHRLLNHWDNLDGSIERGYAGRSLWKWDQLPGKLDQRYTDYARACASIGINGVALNNVNADPRILTGEYLVKVKALADLWRPYGIRVYLSANFAAPKMIGGLATADPTNPTVRQWWRDKADEIYRLIPDFGGFVVKANSEWQPGPQEYGRTHADGANLLADALAPHHGIVMWRAFVYEQEVDPDRAKRAFIEFTKLDGQFHEDVIVQVKNGPIDFQPREPFHPLFGAMPNTPLIAELQITQEYLGQANHLVFLAPMWKEFLDSDTYARGKGTPVSKTFAGICGVANTGSDVNWCGHHFAQANCYAFGRLAWDPDLSAEQIAREWIAQTFEFDQAASDAAVKLMLDSWETFVSYTMPLGLHHLIGGDHYAPQPWNSEAPREDWTAWYYHRADKQGIGFDRTRHGSGAVDQYRPTIRDQFGDPRTCPEKFLLWFHRLPWDHPLASGRNLWEELCFKYADGAERAAAMQHAWQALRDQMDPQRFSEVAEKLTIQAEDARRWRDACLDYFRKANLRVLPARPDASESRY